VLLPLGSAPAIRAATGGLAPARSLEFAVRAAPGHTSKDVGDMMAAFGRSLDDSAPLAPRTLGDGTVRAQPRYWTTIATDDDARYDQGSEFGRVIVALPGLVLLIACTNIANLVLSGGASRRQDFGVRRALGASRWQLIREQLIEQGVVAVTGGLGAVVFANWLIDSAARIWQTTLAPFMSGAPIDWHLHGGVWPATLFGIGLSLIVCGVIPALQLTRDSLRSVLAQGDGASTPRWRGRGNLIALQLGVSVGLFLIALVFVNILVNRPGTPTRALPAVSADVRIEALGVIPFRWQGHDDDFERAYVDRVLAEASASPDVEAAAVTTAPSRIPGLQGSTWSNSFQNYARAEMVGARPLERRSFDLDAVSPNYFAATGLTLTHGRTFAADEPNAIVVNEGLGLDVFGTTDVVGRTLSVTIADRASLVPPAAETLTIVGVVPGRVLRPRSQQHENTIYVPFALHTLSTVAVVARGRIGSPPPTAPLSRALAAADPDIAVAFVSAADVVAQGPLAFAGYIVTALMTLAFLALGMATVGLYGVLSHVMARRTREIGIRVALGATPRAIATLVLRDGFRPILEGLFIGLATAAVIRYFMLRTMVQESVGSFDPVAVGLTLLLLSAAGAAACWLPARRATRITPTSALRSL
jgi:predicted permease